MVKFSIGLKVILFSLLVTLAIQLVPTCTASPAPILSIYGKVVDANNGSAISGATVLMWDMATLERPKPGAGMYFTNEEGEYNATAPYIKSGHIYRIYAYRGNTTTMSFDYIPQKYGETIKMGPSPQDVSFRLVPGASIYLSGKIYVVETPLQPLRLSVRVNSLAGSPCVLNASYISEYGDTSDRWFLLLDRRLIVVPSGMPVSLSISAWFLDWETGRGIFEVPFNIDNEALGFTLSQGKTVTHTVSEYGLSRSLNVLDAYIMEVSHEVDEAHREGFYIAEERQTLRDKAQQGALKARQHLINKEYDESFTALREAYEITRGIHLTLGTMRLISSVNAVYLPAFFAAYSVILAFFVFENERRKLFSSLIFYAVFLTALFWIYPGTRIAAGQVYIEVLGNRVSLFWLMAIGSISSALALVFGASRLWREPEVEGKVSLTSVTSVIFSMAKRQIRRRRLRGFFTITSVVILVLAFTSLTSFGTVYGLTSERLTITSPADGILVKRPGTQTEGGVQIPFTPLSSDDISLLSSSLNIKFVAPKLENIPDTEPIGRLETVAGKTKVLYGTLGVAPANENLFTRLGTIMKSGSYLGDEDENAILISTEAAAKLGVNVGDMVKFYIRGVSGFLANFTIRGLFDDSGYAQLVDLNGEDFRPKRIVKTDDKSETRACNSSDIILMNWRTALGLQQKASALSSAAPQFAALSRIAFQPVSWGDLDGIIYTLTFAFDYHAYVSREGRVTLYNLGFRYEAKGAAEILIPMVMVGLNVGAVMLNAVYERRREMEILSVVGLNPAHMALLFVAEGIVIGMVGGGLGYLFGLGFYRIMSFLGVSLMVREKLEWWWSAIGFGLAILASVLSTVRPAMIAVRMYTPSMVRKFKLTEKEQEVRQEEIFTVYQARRLTMPVKVLENEAIFFFSYLVGRIKELELGTYERTDGLVEEPELETPKGELIKRILFNYVFSVGGKKRGTKNELICTKGPKENYYRVELDCTPAESGTPEEWVERAVKIIRDIQMDWLREKKRIMGIP